MIASSMTCHLPPIDIVTTFIIAKVATKLRPTNGKHLLVIAHVKASSASYIFCDMIAMFAPLWMYQERVLFITCLVGMKLHTTTVPTYTYTPTHTTPTPKQMLLYIYSRKDSNRLQTVHIAMTEVFEYNICG